MNAKELFRKINKKMIINAEEIDFILNNKEKFFGKMLHRSIGEINYRIFLNYICRYKLTDEQWYEINYGLSSFEIFPERVLKDD